MNLVFRLYTPHNTGAITSTIYFSGETGDRRFLVSRSADSNWAVKEAELERIVAVQSTPFTMADRAPFYPGFYASGPPTHNEA
ncbi:hypothetical protein N7447_007911 [Penicillium robsamsonii]|uniref:uncharacterized protein n=1 Tax=Penicillium robsamsonii TaxID=1792511 RepID=UPI002546932C|nr:uncharacterized protein N7447_007911 [Penicillium robsamsonii]KAJ5817903.1 hypothetical protein N7447_007911 [Penicillium robsamsonii]